jgi:threonine dehydratase
MIELSDVLAARQVVQPHVWRTPLLPSPALSREAEGDVYLKLECWQRTGSFKVRGALNKLAHLSDNERGRELVTASAGNHGLGIAYASQVLGIPQVVVFVPENIPLSKLNRLAAFNVRVNRSGRDYDAAHVLAATYAEQHAAVYLSAYDDPVVIAGQGTVGLEIMEDLNNADVLLVPVGGGGLIAGIANVAKTMNPGVRIVGVQPEASPSAYLSLRKGRPYETYAAGPTCCDGLAGGFGRVPFEIAASLIDEIVVVPEADIRWAVGWLVTCEQIIAEGSGAISIAPLLNGQLDANGQRIVAVLTGRNIDLALLRGILGEQQQRHDSHCPF